MKKVWTIVLIALMMLSMVTSCGKGALVGTWTTAIDGAEGQITLYKDGTGTVVSNDISRPCTWEAADGKLTVVQEIAQIPYTFLDGVSYVIKGKTLTVTSQNGNTLVFEKE